MKRIKLLPELIMLTAGLITCIIAVIKKFDNTEALTTLLIVLLSFYCLGVIARFVIRKVCFPEPPEEENAEDLEEDGEAVIEQENTEQESESGK